MMCRERLHNSAYSFHELCRLGKFKYADCVSSVTLEPFEIFLQSLVQIYRIIRESEFQNIIEFLNC